MCKSTNHIEDCITLENYNASQLHDDIINQLLSEMNLEVDVDTGSLNVYDDYTLLMLGGVAVGFYYVQKINVRECRLNLIYVIERCRNHGIASISIEKLKETYDHIYLTVDVTNKPAVDLYKSLGFEIASYDMEYCKS